MDREPELHPSGIIPRSFAIAIGIAIERSWFSLSALSAGNACLRAPAQAGVPTAQVENTKSKRTISIESRPCWPGWETEAASFRKMGKQLGMDR